MHLTLLLVLGAFGSPAATLTPDPIPTSKNQESSLELLDNKALQVAVQRLANEFPELVTVLPVGNSRTGRKIDALRVAAGSDNPSILVVANLDGPLAYTSSIALEEARNLASAYGDDERITRLLETTTFYFIPRANPDAAAARFAKPLMEVEATGHGIDNDRDGRNGEDSPSDVNGDGFLTWMRVPDPTGEWTLDPSDPRVLIKADPEYGDQGQWKLMREAGDPDGDEAAGEDPKFDAIVNRNFPARWEEHTARAGLYSTDEPESRSLIEFVLAHKDIALVVVYGKQDNLVKAPKGIADDAKAKQNIPAKGIYKSDAALLARLAKKHKELTKSKARGSNEDEGSFQLWCYEHRGLLTLNSAVWSPPLEVDDKSKEEDAEEEADDKDEDEDKEADDKSKSKRKPSDDAKMLAAFDQIEDSRVRFMEWKTFEHPTLGTVDIGGFAPYARVEPPVKLLAELARKEGEFLIELGDWLPRVTISKCTVKSLGAGLLRVEATIQNSSRLPLATRAAERNRALESVEISILASRGAQFLAGKQREFIRELPALGGQAEFTWLIANAAGPIQVNVRSPHAGEISAVPTEDK